MSGPTEKEKIRSMRRSPGFTLLELLVVIAVIALIAGILFPVFAQAREKARQTVCLSNTRQIGMAQSLYTQDNDDELVPWVIGPWTPDHPELARHQKVWTDLLESYVKNRQVYFCPSFSEARFIQAAAAPDCWGASESDVRGSIAGVRYLSHYGMQFYAFWGECTASRPRVAMPGSGWTWEDGGGFKWMRLAEVAHPAETANIAEGFTSRAGPDEVVGIFQGCEGAKRHFDGQNIVCLDGHAKHAPGNPEVQPNHECGPATIRDKSYAKCFCSSYLTFDR